MLRRLFRRGPHTQITDNLGSKDLKDLKVQQQQTSNPKVQEDVNIKIYQNNDEHFRLDSLVIMDRKDSGITSNIHINEQSSPNEHRNEQSSPNEHRNEQSSPNEHRNEQGAKDDLAILMDKLVRESDQTREKIRDISYETHKKMEFESQRIRDAIDRLCDQMGDKWPNIGICCGCTE